jgi:hypothetical protein
MRVVGLVGVCQDTVGERRLDRALQSARRHDRCRLFHLARERIVSAA